MTENVRRVAAIRDGTVIDHIPAGRALLVLSMLGVGPKTHTPVSLVMNVSSPKHGQKDIIKIEDRELDQMELDRLALIAGQASVSIIRNFSLSEKRQVTMPDEFLGIMPCMSSNCISNSASEQIRPRLKVVTQSPVLIRCFYCERIQPVEDLIEAVT